MSDIITIMKKELKRFFSDKRILLSLILPGVLIYVMYSFMGSIFENVFSGDKDYTYIIAEENKPDSFNDVLKRTGIKYEIKKAENEEKAKADIKDGNVDIYIKFDENFDEKASENAVPSVEVYYDSANVNSQTAYTLIYSALLERAVKVTPVYLVNAGEESYDLATKQELSAMMITMMLPFILMIFLFTGCMAVSTESIAGEKERGTIATLLVTPVKRSHIAIGKILALSITSLVSAVISFIGLILSLPKLMGGEATGISLSAYGFSTYIGTLGVIIVTVLLFTVILSIVSALSKSIKEASQFAMPVMIVVMAVAVLSMVNQGAANTNWWAYLIPVYNSAQCISGLFSLSFNSLFFVITVISNIVFVGLGVFALAKIFNSEKIMFNK
ncbi:MAG: ABC transporter permease [Clostridia bacterium]|nr:ABC transporter permease [Clostridia bacterium]